MKKFSLMSGIVLMIGVSTLSISTPVKAAPKDPISKYWEKVRGYMGYDDLQQKYQNDYNEHLKQQEKEDERIRVFLNDMKIQKKIKEQNTRIMKENQDRRKKEYQINKQKKLFLPSLETTEKKQPLDINKKKGNTTKFSEKISVKDIKEEIAKIKQKFFMKFFGTYTNE
ncbi:hypothetical protein CN553_26635 [Bacillus cereus]|uniref:Uncharacterized protein n=1 Tax=Bacillus cereus TaxID=1396 RepID=A0A9X6U704_BACCE|nr:hypothetical protein [Bacillus cereus]PEN85549.1 hypothetical protein CN553_26635 [Bacillus cereus]